jgi:enamine deaminase RidA (YjgF/YER057c/UK114 family)
MSTSTGAVDGEKMQLRTVNPWSWQAGQGWSWGVETVGAQRVLYCSGQVPTDASGRVLHEGDLRAQIGAALDNLEAVLRHAGYALRDLVRIDYYTTDATGMMQNWDVIKERLNGAGSHAGGVLLQVSQLATPALLVEIQAIAAR